MFRHRPLGFVGLLAVAMAWGCGGSGGSPGGGTADANTPETGGGMDSGGMDSGGGADTGGADGGSDAARDAASTDGGDAGSVDGGDGGGARDGGDGGILAHAGLALVPGGVSATSPSYQMVTTTGQSPGGNRTMSSPTYRMNGGVVGATQGR